MRRIRIGVVGAGLWSEWAVLPVLQGPDAVAPPDEGAWWSRRPVAGSTIRWQAPFRPEVVALCEPDESTRARVAAMFRIATQYAHWRDLLRETAPDVLFCENGFGDDGHDLLNVAATQGVKAFWLGGAIQASAAQEVLRLADFAGARGVNLWWARPMRRAAAHRAALQLVGRGEIGDVTALSLRWSNPFATATGEDAALRASSLAALDLLLACAGAAPIKVLASTAKGVLHLWLQFESGATATAVFASTDNWNSPLPRLEICGTQGRFLVCEAGRKMWFYQPHEAARLIEPPGLAAHVSAANVSGVAEDVKAFLGVCAQDEKNSDRKGLASREWLESARAVAVLNAVHLALQSGQVVPVETLSTQLVANSANGQAASAPTAAVTLPLSL